MPVVTDRGWGKTYSGLIRQAGTNKQGIFSDESYEISQMVKEYNLDFSQLKRVDAWSIYISLPSAIEKILIATLPETSARIIGAMKFCWYIKGSENTLFADEPKATRLRESFLRASLAELFSIEETIQRDLPLLDPSLKPIKLTDFENPLLHLIRELRNLEIHLTSSPLMPTKIQARYEDQERELTIWVVPDLTIQKFEKLRNARNYRPEDIQKMVTWFNEAQQDWGVTDLLYRSICEVAEKLISDYSLEKYQNK